MNEQLTYEQKHQLSAALSDCQFCQLSQVKELILSPNRKCLKEPFMLFWSEINKITLDNNGTKQDKDCFLYTESDALQMLPLFEL